MPANNTKTLKNIETTGQRLTDIRRALIDIFSVASEPLSVQTLLSKLARKKLAANKTTVYRQLAALQENGLIHEVNFADRTKRYELTPDNHHHHLICLKCKQVADVSFKEDIARQEKYILRHHGFKVERHALEFFGRCAKCQRK